MHEKQVHLTQIAHSWGAGPPQEAMLSIGLS